MPFAFLIVGLMLVVIGARNETANAVALLKSEFTGPNSFVPWLIALGIIGALGYFKPVKPVSDGFMGLIILVMIIDNENNGGLFARFEQALSNTTATPSPSSTAGATSSTSGAAASAPQTAFGVASPPASIPGNTLGGFDISSLTNI